ncbi:tetraspanin-8-like [Nerophis lumbriciformis]|uniref:tetraspanin-8-like n=1 Tax=Nerophis lumbriciformis TaxID=546530 RepID=UPI002ADF0E35|nr:tetraspanin-8-like [Nerophis lumbriciformis]
MAQVNRCLKLTFILSNLFFAIVGVVIISLALLMQVFTRGTDVEGRSTALILMYVVGTITMLIAALGAYGAHSQSRAALIVFLVCMVIGSLLMLRVGIPFAAFRPEVESMMEDKFRQMLPLDATSEQNQHITNNLQEILQCCGLFSYDDWRMSIPDSCLCDGVAQLEGKCQTVRYDLLMLQVKKSVYIQPCFPLITHYVLLGLDVIIGVAFVLAILALLGLTLSSIIIHQLRETSRPTLMMVVPSIFKSAPPKYQELHNPPMY